MTQELSKSDFYDPNLDFVTCLSLVTLTILCTLCILIPVFTVLLASSSSTNWFAWIFSLIIVLAILAAIGYCFYRQQVQNEEGRMVRREQDFARRLDKINRMYRQKGE